MAWLKIRTCLVAIVVAVWVAPYASANEQLRPPEVLHWCSQHCSTWVWVGNRYVGQGAEHPERFPKCGVTVEKFTLDAVVMHRTDCGQYPGKAELTGKLSRDGNSIVDGTISWTWHPCCGLATGRYIAAWGPAIDTIPGSDEERDRRLLADRTPAEAETHIDPPGPPVDFAVQNAVCTSKSVRVAMQSVENRAIHDPNGAALQALTAAFTGVDASAGSATFIDSAVGADNGRYTSKDPGSFVCRALFVRGDVKIEATDDENETAHISAKLIEEITSAHPSFIEWFKVKPLQDASFRLTLLPSSLQLAQEYSTVFQLAISDAAVASVATPVANVAAVQAGFMLGEWVGAPCKLIFDKDDGRNVSGDCSTPAGLHHFFQGSYSDPDTIEGTFTRVDPMGCKITVPGSFHIDGQNNADYSLAALYGCGLNGVGPASRWPIARASAQATTHHEMVQPTPSSDWQSTFGTQLIRDTLNGKEPSTSVDSTRSLCAAGRQSNVDADLRRSNPRVALPSLFETCMAALMRTAHDHRLNAYYDHELKIIYRKDKSYDRMAHDIGVAAQARKAFAPVPGGKGQVWELDPALAFDAGFSEGYQNDVSPGPLQGTMEQLRKDAEACFSQQGDVSHCFSIGYTYGYLVLKDGFILL